MFQLHVPGESDMGEAFARLLYTLGGNQSPYHVMLRRPDGKEQGEDVRRCSHAELREMERREIPWRQERRDRAFRFGTMARSRF